mgnify:FL=1
MAGKAKTTKKTPFEETGRKAEQSASFKALKGGNRVANKQRLLSTVGPKNSTSCNILRLTSVLSAGNGNDDGLRVGFTEGFRFNPKGLSRKSAKVWINKDSLKDVFVSPDYCVTINEDGTQQVNFQQLSAATTTSLASVIEELDLVDSEVTVDLYLYFANIYTKVLDENPFEQVDLDCYDIVEDYDGEVIHKAKFLVNSISGFEEGTTEVAIERTAEVVAAE